MKCPHCGAEIPDDSRNCPSCGTPIIKIKPKRVCMNCGSEVPDGAEVCPGCGRKIRRRPEQKDSCRSSASGANAGASTGCTQKNGGSRQSGFFILPGDRFALMQCILPAVAAVLYHSFILQQNLVFNLINTALLYEGLIFFFGYMDFDLLEERFHNLYGRSLDHRYRSLSCFLPVLGFFERRKLPGQDPKAWYPYLHVVILILFLIYTGLSSFAMLPHQL